MRRSLAILSVLILLLPVSGATEEGPSEEEAASGEPAESTQGEGAGRESTESTTKKAINGGSRLGREDDGSECWRRLARSDVLEAIGEHGAAIDECIAETGSTEGMIELRFAIDPSGTVESAEIFNAEFFETDVGECLVEVIEEIDFPKMCSGRDSQLVRIPFDLSRKYDGAAYDRERLTRAEIQSTVRRYEKEIDRCGTTTSDARGVVEIRFSILSSGAVESAAIATEHFRDTEVGQCVVDVVESMEFPAVSPVKKPRKVRFPFKL